MPDKKYDLPETFLNVVRSDREYGIFLLEGEQLIFFPARPRGEWNIGDVLHSSRHRRATGAEMKYYFDQVAPHMGRPRAKVRLWRKVDVFGREGSIEKEAGIKNRILAGVHDNRNTRIA